ncbi:HAMP domain-containing histidine kinase [Pseudohalioglobus lutimaris]|uniref:histidine kinase n=1 Tax=Pseudohalioglobus lutimaris TaxID=1737061 RepID=A0A2N5X3D8_9GAMM|nr:HAMP domain-containing histidine kinase [Pseudohalioglobus lutimaris]PLW69016.1 HAMP domain-containing histidine kinase [Pseudohalioglobus lutimaris]
MRGSLFIKIFLGFWLVTVAVLGSWLLASQYFESLHFTGVDHRPAEGPPQRRVLRLIWALENAPAGKLPGILSTARREHRLDIWLLDDTGRDMLQQPVPDEVGKIAQRLDNRRRRALKSARDKYYVAHAIIRPGEPRWRLVMAFPPPPHRVLGVLGANPWLRLLLAILVSGLACWGLSRLMTHRLRDLRRASAQLAEGDLSARIRVRERGGDETDALARDFNAMADQLEARIQAQRQLLRDVSHELRSPLARMRVALALAMESAAQPEDHLARMDKETTRLEELISQLLSSQQQTLEMDTHIDLVALLRTLCADASFEGRKESKEVTLHTSLSQAVVASSGDLLLKSFENIIRNALHHSPPGATVRVELSREPGCYRVNIEDQGPGVAEEDLKRIFEEFYRVDSARTREAGGYGLGLAIAWQAINRHGGTLSASNTETGLRITADLPTGPQTGA